MLIAIIALCIYTSLMLLQGSRLVALRHMPSDTLTNEISNIGEKITTTRHVEGENQKTSNNSKVLNIPQSTEPRRKHYAFVITITKDGFFLDGAAVLAFSILKYSWNASYFISFVAFVHPNVTLARPGLRRLGFHVIEVPIPVNTTAIQFDFLREKINKNGCCGSAELIKLSSYRLLQYDRVIHLDADVMLLNPLDPVLDLDYSLVYTTDPNMATYKKLTEQMPVQGGFLVLRPSLADYRAIIATEMRTEFRQGKGWNASLIGWYWGGMTVQGILPYYYHRVSAPNRSLIVDRCHYNTMADTPECATQQLGELRSAHFTVCQKPWTCLGPRGHVNRLCQQLHERWFQLRAEAEAFYGMRDGAEGSQAACTRGRGQDGYSPLRVHQARLPALAGGMEGSRAHYRRNLLPDTSPDRLEPLPEARYFPGRRFD